MLWLRLATPWLYICRERLSFCHSLLQSEFPRQFPRAAPRRALYSSSALRLQRYGWWWLDQNLKGRVAAFSPDGSWWKTLLGTATTSTSRISRRSRDPLWLWPPMTRGGWTPSMSGVPITPQVTWSAHDYHICLVWIQFQWIRPRLVLNCGQALGTDWDFGARVRKEGEIELDATSMLIPPSPKSWQ